MEKILALFDRDQNYTARFARYVQNRKQFPFSVYTFTDPEVLRQFSRRREIEILLTAGKEEEGAGAVQAKDVIHLAESSAGFPEDGAKYIYKYQSGDAIMRELLHFYGNSANCAAYPGTREADVVMVFSPLGRCGKSTLALSVASALAREKRTLYVSFEEFSWLPEITGGAQRGSMTEALYYFKEEALDALKLKALIYSEGELDYLPPVRNPADLSALSPAELERFLYTLRSMGGYDMVVVDTDSVAGRFADAFRQCKTVLVPVPTDEMSGDIMRKFSDFIDKNGEEQLKKRMKKIQIPKISQNPARERLQWFAGGELGALARDIIRNHIYGEEQCAEIWTS